MTKQAISIRWEPDVLFKVHTAAAIMGMSTNEWVTTVCEMAQRVTQLDWLVRLIRERELNCEAEVRLELEIASGRLDLWLRGIDDPTKPSPTAPLGSNADEGDG